MKKLLPALALSALFGTQTASAQQMRASLKDSLQKASDLMYERGSYDFITVSGVKDGIIKLSKSYEFNYSHQQFRFKKAKMSKRQREEYTAKFQAYLKKQGMSDKTTINMRSGGINLEDIFDTTSSAWNNKPYKVPDRSDSVARLGDLLWLNMIQDKLVEANERVEIIYKPGFISLNGKQLEHPHAEKYIAMIEEVNGQSGKHASMMRFSTTISLDKLRYPQPGPEVKDK